MGSVRRREFIRRTLAAAAAAVVTPGGQALGAAGRTQRKSIAARAVTRGPKHHFFGYYDKQQWDARGRYLLCQEVGFIDRPPTPDDSVTVGMVDLAAGNRWHPLAETKAWCWQQGTMLQWVGSAPDRLIIHNARGADRFVSVVRDVKTGKSRTLPLPVYAISPDGKQALSLNFARLGQTRPGYGYYGLRDPWVNNNHPGADGIYWMNLESGEHRMIVSYAQVVDIRHNRSMDGVKHWFNHLLFSPDGSRFIFLHRWKSGGGMKTRMFTARPDGSDLHVIADHGVVSHFIWCDPGHILAWSREPETGDRYHLYTDKTDRVEVVGEGILTVDGHCSYSPDRRWILTDSYPDRERMRTLILYDPAERRRIEIGRFLSPAGLEGEIRCDLHPRWSRDGRGVCIDSAHEGNRQVYLLDVSSVVKGD